MSLCLHYSFIERKEREAPLEGNDGKRRIMITKGQGKKCDEGEDEVEIFEDEEEQV